MSSLRFLSILIVAIFCVALVAPAAPAAADSSSPLLSDALRAPAPQRLASSADNPVPDKYQPSAFLAGKVAVQLVFAESDGRYEPSSVNWKASQINEIQSRIATALDWWAQRMPNARLSFDLTSVVVNTGYEPIEHGLNTESQWVGDTLNSMGIGAPNYFEQAYAADEALRQARGADWGTTIFVVNSSGVSGGRFADGHFAYAYINGPFLVITSDAGPYGTRQLSQVVAHEFGHIFGALDQYAAAGVPCSQQSGYLAVPTSNSQWNNCGTKNISIMLEPLSAYLTNQIDESALGQVGYYDSDHDAIPDPIDTAPALQVRIEQPGGGGRPVVSGLAIDQPYPSLSGELLSINKIVQVEYRVDAGVWMALPAADGAYDSVREQLNATLALYDGPHQVELRATNQIGAQSAVRRYNLVVSGAGADPGYRVSAPAVSSSQAITLGLAAPAGSQVQLSESPSFGGAWLAAPATLAWELSAAEGQHTIYARFRDAQGLESPTLAAQVTLDRTPPTGYAWLRKSGGGIWLEILAHDARSQVAEMQISAGADAKTTWQPFQPELEINLQSDTIYVRLRDAAGNVTDPFAASPASPIWIPLAQG